MANVWDRLQNQQLKEAQIRALNGPSFPIPAEMFDFNSQIPNPPTPQIPMSLLGESGPAEQISTDFVPQNATILRETPDAIFYSKPTKTHKENVNSTRNLPIEDTELAQLRQRVSEDPSLASLSGGIDQSNEYKRMLAELPMQVDTTPVARFLDNTFGTNYSTGLKAPESAQDRVSLLAKIQDSINKDEQAQSAQRLAISNFINGAGGKEAKAVADTEMEQLGVVNKKKTKGPPGVNEKRVTDYTKAISPILAAKSAVDRLKESLDSNGDAGLGMLQGNLPIGALTKLEEKGLAKKGAVANRTAITNAANLINKALNSAKASDRDFERAKEGASLIATGSKDNIDAGVRILEELSSQSADTIEAGYNDKELETARSRVQHRAGTNPGLFKRSSPKMDKDAGPSDEEIKRMSPEELNSYLDHK